VLTGPEADKVFKTYNEKKWHDLMEEQIRSSGANEKGFSQWKGVDLFNIRYLPEDLELYENMIEVPTGHYINSLSRYSFSRYVDQPLIEEDEMVNFGFQENKAGRKEKKGSEVVVDLAISVRKKWWSYCIFTGIYRIILNFIYINITCPGMLHPNIRQVMEARGLIW
jgi:hypothetical protein